MGLRVIREHDALLIFHSLYSAPVDKRLQMRRLDCPTGMHCYQNVLMDFVPHASRGLYSDVLGVILPVLHLGIYVNIIVHQTYQNYEFY